LTRSRKSTKRALPDAAATRVAHLQRKLEDERARVARRLHNDVAGMLAAARMDLSRIAGRIAEDLELRDQVARVDQILEQVIQNARAEMQRLHPALLDHFGLSTALRHIVEERCRAAGTEYSLDLPESTGVIPAPASLATFRVIELLLEGKSLRRVALRLRESTASWQLLAEIEGVEPIDAESSEDLQALRSWLESMGATWSEAQRGDVACVELTLPRAQPAPAAAPGG
jgi:two-component system sensor histidine kinase UhpB